MPLRGDTVELTGLHRHAELNGAVGEIIAAPVIGDGWMTVRLASGGSTKDLKVHHRCLRPSMSASAPSLPSLPKSPVASQAASALHAGNPGSLATLESALLPATGGAAASQLWSEGHRSQASRSVAAATHASGSCAVSSRGRRGAASQPPTPVAAAPAASTSAVPLPPQFTWRGKREIEDGAAWRPFVTTRQAALLAAASAASPTPSAASAASRRRGGGVEAMREQFMAKHAKWTQGVIDRGAMETGEQGKEARLSTDVTAFEKEFQRVVGLPTYKAFPKQEVILRDPRTRLAAPPWAP